MALDHYEIIDAYRYLKKICNTVNNSNIENYLDQSYRIDSNLRVLKKFINSTYETSFKDDSIILCKNIEILQQKLWYYIRHKEDEVLRNVKDACNVVVFE